MLHDSPISLILGFIASLIIFGFFFFLLVLGPIILYLRLVRRERQKREGLNKSAPERV